MATYYAPCPHTLTDFITKVLLFFFYLSTLPHMNMRVLVRPLGMAVIMPVNDYALVIVNNYLSHWENNITHSGSAWQHAYNTPQDSLCESMALIIDLLISLAQNNVSYRGLVIIHLHGCRGQCVCGEESMTLPCIAVIRLKTSIVKCTSNNLIIFLFPSPQTHSVQRQSGCVEHLLLAQMSFCNSRNKVWGTVQGIQITVYSQPEYTFLEDWVFFLTLSLSLHLHPFQSRILTISVTNVAHPTLI